MQHTSAKVATPGKSMLLLQIIRVAFVATHSVDHAICQAKAQTSQS